MATLITENGERREVKPANGKSLTLEDVALHIPEMGVVQLPGERNMFYLEIRRQHFSDPINEWATKKMGRVVRGNIILITPEERLSALNSCLEKENHYSLEQVLNMSCNGISALAYSN